METFTTLPEMIRYVMNTYRNSAAFNYRDGNEWRSISTELFLEKVRRLSLGLKRMGLKKGECVGILAKPSPYWLIIDLATMIAGGVSVPLFPYVSQENFFYQVADCNMQLLFVVSQELWDTYNHQSDSFRKIITLDVNIEKTHGVMDMREVMLLGDKESESDPSLYIKLGDQIQENDLATIIYTSGSTGQPKGVELTHRNIISQTHAGHVRLNLNPRDDRVISMLPLAHIFERTLMYYYISSGVSVYFVDEIKNLVQLCQEVKPTITAVVPRILEKVYSRMENAVEKAPYLKKKIARWAFSLASNSTRTPLCSLQSIVAKRLVFNKLKNTLGGKFRVIISGGASLPEDLCRFFLNVGIPVFQGYGLTETSPVLATNFPGYNKPGTVGPIFPGVEISFGTGGEILARGPNVMRGYHNRPKRTAQSIDSEGWFHTGDVGSLDKDGFLKVTGRVKEIFKTSNGKMVSPIPIEQALSKSHIIDMAMVIAEGRKFVTTLLFPDLDILATYKSQHNASHFTDEEFLDSETVREEIAELLKTVNHNLNRWEKVRKYCFISRALSVEKGELTPTLKIRRKAVEEKYSSLIESMYQEASNEHFAEK